MSNMEVFYIMSLVSAEGLLLVTGGSYVLSPLCSDHLQIVSATFPHDSFAFLFSFVTVLNQQLSNAQFWIFAMKTTVHITLCCVYAPDIFGMFFSLFGSQAVGLSSLLFIHACSHWFCLSKGGFTFYLSLIDGYKACKIKKNQQIDDKIAGGRVDSHCRHDFTLYNQCKAACWFHVWQSAQFLQHN